MKIDQLPMGARFEYRGQVFTKTGPMMATSDAGGSQFIPKHAVLQPLGGEPPVAPPPTAARSLEATRVLAAFEIYHREASRLVGGAGRQALEVARARFLAELR